MNRNAERFIDIAKELVKEVQTDCRDNPLWDTPKELVHSVEEFRELIQLVKEIVGNHDPEQDENCKWGHDFQATVRNELRDEIHKELDSIIETLRDNTK